MNNSLTFAFKALLEKEKLKGINFNIWYRNLRIILKPTTFMYVLDTKPLPEPKEADKAEVKAAYQKWAQADAEVTCLMLANMEPGLQRQYENMKAYDIIQYLSKMYEDQVKLERYELTKRLFKMEMTEGGSVHKHVVEMIEIIDRLVQLGTTLPADLAVNAVLQSLPASYGPFIMHYNMDKGDKPLPEILNMLRVAEHDLKKSQPNSVLMIQNSKGKGKAKAKGKSKAKPQSGSKTTTKSLKPKAKVAKAGECHHCHQPGHWRRNCPLYLDELRKKKAQGDGASTSGIYVIDVNLSNSIDWF